MSEDRCAFPRCRREPCMGYMSALRRICWHHWDLLCKASDEGREAHDKLLRKIGLARWGGEVVEIGVYNKRARNEDRRADEASTKSPLIAKEALESVPDAAARPPGPIGSGDEAGSSQAQPGDPIENLEAPSTA